MNLPLVSVIIPVYNVEKYLDRCVSSLLGQTFQNLEIILIDDGSTDNSGLLCDDYSKKDARIKVYHQSNRGQASARNLGLANCSGNYISFIDSDDWVDCDFYEFCLNIMNSYNAEVVQIEILATSGLVNIKQPKIKNIELNGKEILQNYMLSTTVKNGYSLCRCLFKANLLENTFFRVGKINEDIDYKFNVLAKATKMIISNQIKYYYYQDCNSTTRGGLKQKDFDLREAADILCELCSKENYGSIKYLGMVKKARTAFSLLCKIAYYGVADEHIDELKITKELVHEHRKNSRVLLFSPMSFSRKILVLMFAINFDFSKMIIRKLRKMGFTHY